MEEIFEASASIRNFGIYPGDPGYIYVIRSGARLKIGRTVNKETRLREARTWLPDGSVIGIKPFWNHARIERFLHIGLSAVWYEGEWYEFEGDEFESTFVDEFQCFDDVDINRNSIDFVYFMNSSGMSDFTLEFSENNLSKTKFQKMESGHSRYR